MNYMTLFTGEKDMNEMLDSICPEGEAYQGKAWETLMSGTAEMLALGTLSNVSCYVGVAEKNWSSRCWKLLISLTFMEKSCFHLTGLTK